MSTQQAITTQSFVNSIGVNTHLDFQNYGYQNLSVTEAAINYLGVTNLRDSAQSSVDVGANGLWQQVANATGAKFVDFLPEGSVADMQNALPIGEQLAAQGILNYLEGGNEEDDSYPAGLGNSVQAAASFQQQVYAAGQQLGLPVINISFGAGWTAANNWHGDYDKVGDLSAYCNYANAHTYPSGAPLSAIQQLNADALLAASSRPVINTEFGYDTNTISQSLAAQYTIDGLLDAYQQGDVKTYLYALFDDGSGNFGLMNQDGTAKPAGLALHDVTTLLKDTGSKAASFTPGSLNYTLSGSGENSLLMQKSDGTDWIAVWDEAGTTQNVTLTLGANASAIKVFDPITGTTATQTVNNTNTVTVSLGGDALLI